MITPAFLQLLGDHAFVFFILFARFVATFSSISFFRREFVSPRIIIVMSMAFSLFVVMYAVLGNTMPAIPSSALFINLALQLLLGFLTGFILNLFVDVFLGIGQIISIQSGLGFVNLYIPRVGSITPLSQFFFITAAVIFFELNGHLIVIKLVIESCKTHLLGVAHIDRDVLEQIMMFTRIIFSGALMLSLAIVIALLVSNITLAIMTKFSPQLNIFSIGITISLITGFFMVYLCFDAILENGRILLNDIIYFGGMAIQSVVT